MEPLIILGVIVVVAVVAVVALHKHATPMEPPKIIKVDPQPDKGKDEHDKEKKN